MSSDDSPVAAASAASNEDAQNTTKSCPVSGQTVYIVPVRYAIDDSKIVDASATTSASHHHPCWSIYENGQEKLVREQQVNSLPDIGHWHGPFRLTTAQYTLRRLRDGWLYVYDEEGKTFHEYQVDGASLIKINWSDDEADKDPADRGTQGASHPYLAYPAKHVLYLSFSYHRWTWRVCEHMRSSHTARLKWMRKLDLNEYCHDDSLYNHHAGYYAKLASWVADIYVGEQPDDNLFSATCTPLVADSEGNDAISKTFNLDLGWLLGQPQLSDTQCLNNLGFLQNSVTSSSSLTDVQKLNQLLKNMPLIESKPAAPLKNYQVPKKSAALFVALDDRLADICDLTSVLAKAWAEKEQVLKSEKHIHQIRMAEITRHIAAVPIPKQVLATKTLTAEQNRQYLASHPEKVLEYEQKLNEALYENYKSGQEPKVYSTAGNLSGFMSSQAADNAQTKDNISYEQKRVDLFTNCGIDITDKMKAQYQELKDNQIPEQINFNDKSTGLYAFLTDIYKQARGKNETIIRRFNDLVAAVKQLKDDPLIVGLDNQYYGDQGYFLSIACQTVLMLKNSCVNAQQQREFARLLSFESPNNLLSLASFGLSHAAWEALEVINPAKPQVMSGLSLKDPNLWVNVFSRIGESTTLAGDKRLQDKAWFQALVTPVKNTLQGLATVYKSTAGKFLNGIIDNVACLQQESGGMLRRSITHVANVLRILLLHMTAGGRAVLAKANAAFASQYVEYIKKLDLHRLQMNSFQARIARGEANGNSKHEYKQWQKLEQEGIMIEQSKPDYLILQNAAARQLVDETKQNALNRLSGVEQQVKNLGGLGSFIAMLNVFNLMAVSYSYDFKDDENDAFDEADRSLVSTWAWTANAVISIFRDKTWEQVIENDIIKKGVQAAIEDGYELVVKRFILRTFFVGITGAIAAGLEASNCWQEIYNKSNSASMKFGYALEFAATVGQAGIFSLQVLFSMEIRIGFQLSIETMLAAWMVTGFWILGVVYLVGAVIIALYTLPAIASWLKQSTWGIDSNQAWTPVEEIKNLERIYYQPAVCLEKVDSSYDYSDQGHWLLKVYLPNLFKGKVIGLNISRVLPIIGPDIYTAQNRPKRVTNSGYWSLDNKNHCPVYAVKIPGTIQSNVNTFIRLPSLLLNGETISYVAKGTQNKFGRLDVKSAEKTLNHCVNIEKIKVEI